MFFDLNALTASRPLTSSRQRRLLPRQRGDPLPEGLPQDTFTRNADGICNGNYFGGSSESAATIISKVAQACSISPKVLLVLLQKEQALITATGPAAAEYQIAARHGLPGHGPLRHPVLRLLQPGLLRCTPVPAVRDLPAGVLIPRRPVQLRSTGRPTASCGTSTVYIPNQATAGLYIYTPYRPNAAALRPATGPVTVFRPTATGISGCTSPTGSAPPSPGGDAVLAAYAARGGASGPLGAWTTWVICGTARWRLRPGLPERHALLVVGHRRARRERTLPDRVGCPA